jgi:predicted phage terminase large subunit-like protein
MGPSEPDPPLDRARLLAEAERARAQAREEFFAYRQYIDPDILWSWWVQETSLHLQQFYEDLVAGKRPKLALLAPPQHGKSRVAEDFIAYATGRNPDWKIIHASFGDELGLRTNLNLQRTIMSPRYQQVFGNTRIGANGWACNNNFIEFAGHAGSFRNVTVNGAINGLELNLGVIDDPVKGRAEAQSPLIRERTWAWFTDDFCSRFAKLSGMLIIMTRWHVDDLVGRCIARLPDLKVLRYPAIAEVADEFRAVGEALFEEFKPLSMLQERRRTLTQASWESLYQQNPIVVGGGILPIEKLLIIPVIDRGQIVESVRYWDKGGDGADGAYTAGVLMHKLHGGRFVIDHVVRGHWAVHEREQKIMMFAALDRKNIKGSYQIIIEQEPGSGGKESAEATLRALAGFRAFVDRVTSSKIARAEPFAAQVQAGNVFLLDGPWVQAFLDEAESFPRGKFKDQIDAAAGAFARLTSKPPFDWDAMQ